MNIFLKTNLMIIFLQCKLYLYIIINLWSNIIKFNLKSKNRSIFWGRMEYYRLIKPSRTR